MVGCVDQRAVGRLHPAARCWSVDHSAGDRALDLQDATVGGGVGASTGRWRQHPQEAAIHIGIESAVVNEIEVAADVAEAPNGVVLIGERATGVYSRCDCRVVRRKPHIAATVERRSS